MVSTLPPFLMQQSSNFDVNSPTLLQSNSDVHIHWKGAAEMVLASCTQFLDVDGSVKSIEEDKVAIILGCN